MRNRAAWIVANNWRIRRRLPRLTRLAETLYSIEFHRFDDEIRDIENWLETPEGKAAVAEVTEWGDKFWEEGNRKIERKEDNDSL